MPPKIPTIATAIINSIRVNPLLLFRLIIAYLSRRLWDVFWVPEQELIERPREMAGRA